MIKLEFYILLIGIACHRNGYSFLSLPLSTSLLSARSLARNSKDAFFTGRPATVRDESLVRRDDLRSIVEELNDRIDKLVVESGEQTDRLSDVTRTLEGLREPRPAEEPWMRFNDKIVLLEKRLDERKFHEANALEMNTIKSEFEELKELYSQLKTCCKTQTEIWNSESMEKRIEGVIADYFDVEVSKSKLSGLVRNLMLATNAGDSTTTGNVTVTSDIGEDRVREIVKEALRIYDADKTGRVDYALESAGGQIISTRCTQRYDIKTRAFKLLAFTLYHENNNPRTVIQGNPIQPGACWAFQGFPGYLLVKLRSPIYVTGFTVEHAPKSILPNGEMRSAPRKFNAWGFTDENDPEPVMFGDYEFAASDESLQYFPVQNTLLTTPYEYVELRVHSNHGQLEYTCLYRFRVHGKSV